MILDIARRETRTWRMAARLAQATYQHEFGARVDPAPDTFMLLAEDDQGGMRGALNGAVAGLSFADQKPLFSEHYLDLPVEKELIGVGGGELSRSEIVEVGPLASTTAGAGRQLVDILAAMCWCQGAKAAVFTVTRRLRVMLTRGGISSTEICRADESRLPEQLRGIWGSYYDTQPVTVYVDLSRHIGEALPLLSGQTTTANSLEGS